jgi:hypothetical protein
MGFLKFLAEVLGMSEVGVVVSSPSVITASVSDGAVQAAVITTPGGVAVDVTGATGPPGPPGTTYLSQMSDVSLSDVSQGDVLRYDNLMWRNYNEKNLVDGGNF